MLSVHLRKVFNAAACQIIWLAVVTVRSSSCAAENLLELDPGAVTERTFTEPLVGVRRGSRSRPRVICGSVRVARRSKQCTKSAAGGTRRGHSAGGTPDQVQAPGERSASAEQAV